MNNETTKKEIDFEIYIKERCRLQKELELNFEQLNKLEKLYDKETDKKIKKELDDEILKLSWREICLLGHHKSLDSIIGDCIEKIKEDRK